uniref:NADH-ubiquinone oxidoreductase chain 6 n=1 Tax=Parochlus steinenii TaxID=315571 RepID=A0A0H4T3G0_9DIPT|nr:NADH dehydrogenase subunit 6 [Parochlus steinenii]AKP94963.1 NADH dehydrogenase subunit 6 [Parochlus steinenii]
MISMMAFIVSFIFMQMKHPLAMGLMLLLQTLFICLISGNYNESFWFSYVLFLIFLGGMLVLFIYVTSLASNEMFTMSMKILVISTSVIMMSILMIMCLDPYLIQSFIYNNEMNPLFSLSLMTEENTTNLNKLYNFPTNLLTILLINYLFLTLIAAVKITNIFYGPLRPKSK